MRVLFYQSSPQHLYGGQLDLLRYFAALDRARIQPHIIAPAAGPFTDRVAALGLPLTVLPLPAELAQTGGALLTGGARARLRQSAKLLPWTLRLARLLRQLHSEVLYANNRRAVLTIGPAARLARVPLLWHIKQDLDRGRMDRLALRLSAAAVACSRDVQTAFQHRHPGHAARIGYAPNGIPLDLFAAAGPDLRTAFGIPPGAVVLGQVGSLTPRKGVDLFVQAAVRLADRHPAAHFILAGEAPPAYASWVQAALAPAQALIVSGRFHTPGWLADTPALYRTLDILALPSRVEGFGLVVAEAAAAGVPCVRSASGGHSETTLAGETGFVVPIADLDALTARLDHLLADPTLRRAMGDAARAHAHAHFSLDHFTTALTAAIISVSNR